MRGFIKLFSVGNLGANPSIGTMPSGGAVANFNLAVNESYRNSTGGVSERTTWLKCHAFDDVADTIGRLCQKGTQVHVEGEFKECKWIDRNSVNHHGFELRVHEVLVLGKGKVQSTHLI